MGFITKSADDMEWIELSEAVVNMQSSCSTRGKEFLEEMSDYQLTKEWVT
jgi:hypothetical protein